MPRTGVAEYEALCTVARLRNFRAAAQELGVAPSALSNTISGLETRLGVRLFNRTTRSVALTEAGEQFVAQLVPALARIDAAVESINGHRETPAGVLRINTNAIAVRQVMPIVAEYLSRYPQMKVDIVTDSNFVDIVAGGFDAGIRLAEAVPKDMIAVPIVPTERHLVVGAPSYFAGRTQPMVPKDLGSHCCILSRLGSRVRSQWDFERQGTKVLVDVKGVVTLDEPNAMLDAALAGVGLAYLDEFLAGEHIAATRLLPILEDWTEAYPGISLFYPGRLHVPAGLRAFIHLIREWRRIPSGRREPSSGADLAASPHTTA